MGRHTVVMKALFKIFILALALALASCANMGAALSPAVAGAIAGGATVPPLFVPAPHYRTTWTGDSENIIFKENTVNAKIKWKEGIGTMRVLPKKREIYYLGYDPAILSDGNIYFQTPKEIIVMEPDSGRILKTHDKLWMGIVDFNESWTEPGKKIFPIKGGTNRIGPYLLIDEKTGIGKTGITTYGEFQGIYGYGYMYEVVDRPIAVAVRVKDLDSTGLKRLLNDVRAIKHQGFTLTFRVHALDVAPDNVLFVYGRQGKVLVEFYGPAGENLLWKSELNAYKADERPLDKVAELDEVVELRRMKELFINQYNDYDKATGEITGHIASLDPATGHVNWELHDIGRVFADKYNDDLVYIHKKGKPEVVYGLDQKTGEEKLKLSLSGYNAALGIIATDDKLFYPVISGARGGSVLAYDKFSAIDKKTGKILWTMDVGSQRALPRYDNGVLYFGDRFNGYGNLVSGSIKKYYGVSWANHFAFKGIPLFLQKTAFAMDAETGKVLWKASLEGTDESYIEKIFVKDNMVFIKSLSGWLYAIEWEKPSSSK